jgi:hypothetical protein
MKGFKDSNNKFHPITQTKGVRKSRDQSAKTKGVMIRKARTVTKIKKLPDTDIGNDNFSFRVDEGNIHLSLDDFGWRWSGEEDQINGFMARMVGTGSEAWDNLVEGFKENGITIQMLKPHLLKSLSGKLTPENDDGLYSLSGDNVRWHFGSGEYDDVNEGEADHFIQEGEITEDERDDFDEEFWNKWSDPTYEEWLEYEGNGKRELLKDEIKKADDFEELESAYTSVREDIQDLFHEFLHNNSIGKASWEAVESIQAKRDEKGVRTANVQKEIAEGKQDKL